MAPKRPPNLGQLERPVAEQKDQTGVSVSDTLSLVVAGDNGKQWRVKQSGMIPQEAKTPHTSSILDKIKYEELEKVMKLGRGSQGQVYLVRHKVTNELYALKGLVFEGDPDVQRRQLNAELTQVASLKHDNIVSSFEAFFRHGQLYVLLEYMDGGTTAQMRARIGAIPEPLLAYIARELLKGLAFLHLSKVVHRDIKPANILVNSKGQVKISDFGVARRFENHMMQTTNNLGSTPYMSPERIRSEPHGIPSDIWSAGLTIAELWLGRFPLGNELKSRTFELCQQIASGHSFQIWDANTPTSPLLMDFVGSCLRPNPAERPTADQLLQHPFLQSSYTVQPVDAGRYFYVAQSSPTEGE